jgi:hypothetical protein
MQEFYFTQRLQGSKGAKENFPPLRGTKTKAVPDIGTAFAICLLHYFVMYITSFTSFTVRETSGIASAARFGA